MPPGGTSNTYNPPPPSNLLYIEPSQDEDIGQAINKREEVKAKTKNSRKIIIIVGVIFTILILAGAEIAVFLFVLPKDDVGIEPVLEVIVPIEKPKVFE